MFSKSCEYGLQAMLYIALHASGKKNIGLKEIATDQGIPAQYLSKILQQLVKKKFLESTKGPNGGFFINKNLEKLTLYQIVIAIDGEDIFEKCGIGLKKCSDKNPCPIHHEYKIIKQRIKTLLKEKSLKELSENIKDGQSIVNFLKH